MSYKILLIDHDEARVERIQRPLAEAGYEVVVASAAEEGLQALEKDRPDLTVIEAMLPEKTGSQLCQEIKENPLGKEMPVILVLEAGEDQQERARDLDLHGCDMLIDDAIPDDDLLNVLGQFLTEKKAEVEEAAEQAAEEPPEAEVAPPPADEPDQSDMLLDSYELDGALQKLDSILEEKQSTEEAEAPLDEEKVLEAQQAGDFSAVADEMGDAGEKPVEQADAQAQHEAVVEEAALLADAGSDIDDRLDSIFSMGEAKPVEAEPEAPVKFYEEIEEEETAAEEIAAPPAAEMEPEEEPEIVAEPVAEAPTVEEPAEELVEPSLEIAAQEAVVEEVAEPEAVAVPVVAPVKRAPRPAPVFEPAAKRGGMKKWWLAAAAVIVVSIAAGAIVLLTGDSAPEPIAVTPPPVEGTPAEEGDLVASAALVESPIPEVEEVEVAPPVKTPPPAPKPEPVAKKPVAKKPKPKPVKAAPKPEPVKVATVTKPEPKPEPVKPAPKPEPKPEPEPEPEKPAPKPEPVMPEPEPEIVKSAPAAVEPKPEPTPAPVVFVPPELLDRVEPVYPRKAGKKAAGRSIVLKLLISESGRIIRVSVEQGVPIPELEAACINAVLRWRYRPAKENGVAVKAWTTAEFSF